MAKRPHPLMTDFNHNPIMIDDNELDAERAMSQERCPQLWAQPATDPNDIVLAASDLAHAIGFEMGRQGQIFQDHSAHIDMRQLVAEAAAECIRRHDQCGADYLDCIEIESANIHNRLVQLGAIGHPAEHHKCRNCGRFLRSNGTCSNAWFDAELNRWEHS